MLPMKVVELPVSATEDRVVGTLDIEAAIREGKRSFETGILADANRNILYVDEINLLDDHVVDVLLDSAAMGINTVEREGISYSHPARFSLVGTMNPEEGDIRPQLLDRFALSVKVVGEQDPEKRAEIIKRRLAYEADPQPFLDAWKDEQEKEVRRIERAMKLLPQVTVSNDILLLAAKISITLGVDGHRADITLIKTAETIAAVEGHTEVTKEDIREASRLALPHRMRRRPSKNRLWTGLKWIRSSTMKRNGFPFAAICGAENAKEAILLTLINPHAGGLLLSGEKGTGKSTLVRSARELLDAPWVEVPISITEDRLFGAIDAEEAIRSGHKSSCLVLSMKPMTDCSTLMMRICCATTCFLPF